MLLPLTLENFMARKQQAKTLNEQLAEAQAMIQKLKEQGAGRYKVWHSQKTNKNYLSFKPSKGSSILLSKLAVKEIIEQSKEVLAACDELSID